MSAVLCHWAGERMTDPGVERGQTDFAGADRDLAFVFSEVDPAAPPSERQWLRGGIHNRRGNPDDNQPLLTRNRRR